uniref:Uncharacterized protein n=1 Tax=Bacillus thuringiensis serovar chinensis CT-43 TaxID=541229 RepID=E7CGF7_BACTU|nr:hypothetical protein pBMB0558_00150 [Bacillus thuringiensis serovar chinensis CT-43]
MYADMMRKWQFGRRVIAIDQKVVRHVPNEKRACLQVDSRGSPGTELEFAL